MTFQERNAFAKDTAQRFNAGMSWGEFQAELGRKPNLFRKDIDDLNRSALQALQTEHGPRISAGLRTDMDAITADGLHPSVFEKVLEREKDEYRTQLRKKITASIRAGSTAEQAAAAHRHPLLTGEDLEVASQRAMRSVTTEKKEKSNAATIGTVVFVLFFVIRMIIRIANN